MTKPIDREDLNQRQKWQGFTKAFSTINYHLEHENYIAAYVIGFSILEDRVNAIFYTRKNIDEKKVNGHVPFARKVRHILERDDISESAMNDWLEEAKRRNAKIHQAMWNIDVFTEEDCNRVVGLAREADGFRVKQKKAYRI